MGFQLLMAFLTPVSDLLTKITVHGVQLNAVRKRFTKHMSGQGGAASLPEKGKQFRFNKLTHNFAIRKSRKKYFNLTLYKFNIILENKFSFHLLVGRSGS